MASLSRYKHRHTHWRRLSGSSVCNCT